MAPTQGTLGIGRQFPGPGNRACEPEPSTRAGLNEKTRPGPGLAVATSAIGPSVQRARGPPAYKAGCFVLPVR